MKTGNGTVKFRITRAEYVAPFPDGSNSAYWTTSVEWVSRRDFLHRPHLFKPELEGVNWIRGWRGKRVDAFKAAVALRPVR